MTRALIAVGCNEYDQVRSLPRLTSAELDASRVFDQLTKKDVGGYESELSTLLLSPTVANVRDAISAILRGGLDTLTFYFAGHGILEHGSFYLCLRDTDVTRLWDRSEPLAHLLGGVAGAQPRQTNIILDACFSGGLVSDLGSIIKPEVLGGAGSPAVTILAMSALDRQSLESSAGGVGTNALLDCINGRAFVQEASASLRLTEIAPVVCERVANRTNQEPKWFALSHSKSDVFCRNPHFIPAAESAFEKWSPRSFLDVLEPILKSHSADPSDLVADVDRLSGGLIQRASGSHDAFRLAEIYAASACSLLEYCPDHQGVRDHVNQLAQRVSDETRSALQKLCQTIAKDKYALLSGRSGFGDLFYLPLRISRILGWAGAAFHIDRALGREQSFPRAALQKLLAILTEDYCGAIASMSDAQAPFTALLATALRDLGLAEEGEAILGLLFASMVEVEGNIADAAIDPDKVIYYLNARISGDFKDISRLLARPSEFAVVMLRSAALFHLEEVFDADLHRLDHLPMNAYVTDDLSQFACRFIPGGDNLSFQMGHDVWRVEDLESTWPDAAGSSNDTSLRCGAILASLLWPDRVPWFVFPAKLEY